MPAPTTKTCPECGRRFAAGHHRQQFCTKAHQVAYGNRMMAEGQAVMALAKAWRAGGTRMKKDADLNAAAKEAFILLCRLVDESNTNDRLANRIHPTRMFLKRKAAGLLD